MNLHVTTKCVIVLLFCIQGVAFSQTNEKTLLFKLDKTINAFGATSDHSVYSTGSTPGFTPRIEFCDSKNGFTIRKDFHIKKYDDNFNLVWEADLKKNYTLQSHPDSETFGDEKNSFFVENATITKIDENGKTSSLNRAGDRFMLNHDMYSLESEIDKKAGKLGYTLTHVEPSTNLLKTEKVEAPWDNYEYSAIQSKADDKNCEWIYLSENENHALLKKVYFKDIEKSKKKEVIIQTLELDGDGKVYAYKKWNFESTFVNDDARYMTPRVAFDEINNELLIFGYMAVDRKNLNGFYIMKYDYTTQNLLYSKEYSFDEIFKDSKSKKTHSSIPMSISVAVPYGITKYDYYLNKKDKVFSIQIITNYHGSTTTYYEVKFDKYGDHVQTDLVEYETYNFYYHNGLKSVPTFHETLMKDTSRPHFTSARPLANDYLNNNPNKSKDEIYAFAIDRLDYSIIVYYNEDSGEFSALKLK